VGLVRIVSGAQTGVDRAALDVAIELGIPCSGWVPKGRIDEFGRIPERYPNLRETVSADFSERTAANVRDSDGTLIISRGPLSGGSLYTGEVADQLGRTCLHVDPYEDTIEGSAAVAIAWLDRNDIKVLNVAGPRASKDPGVHDRAVDVLRIVLRS